MTQIILLIELTNLPHNKPMTELMKMMPITLRKILGEVHLPKDGGETIIHGKNFGSIVCASDGSLVDQDNTLRGGYAYSIQRYLTNTNRILGYAPAPSNTSMSSFTTEIYGQIAALLVLVLLEKSETPGSLENDMVKMYIDNKEVVTSYNNQLEPVNISETLTHDYDLRQLAWKLKQILGTTTTACWVKGHQDRTKEGQPTHGPYTRPAQLNIEMDALATRGVPHAQNQMIKRSIYSTTVFGIFDSKGKYTEDYYQYLNLHVNGPILQAYIQKKYDWSINQQQQINWDDLGKSLQREKEYRKTKIVQILFNWQHDGQQKKHFKTGEGKCPAGCGENEIHGHYLYCKSKEMIIKRQDFLLILKKKLQKIDTYPGITSTLLHALRHGVHSAMEQLPSDVNNSDKYIRLGLEDQCILNNDAIAKGFLSKHWKTAQRWYNTNAEEWTIKAIGFLHEYTYSCWKARNEFIHGKTQKESRKAKRIRLCQTVKDIYSKDRGGLSNSDKKIFKLPIAQRLKSGTASLEIWIDMAYRIFNKNGKDKQTTLHSWLYNSQQELRKNEKMRE